MTEPDLGPILADLAAGRIDAAEAARRIEAAGHAASGTTAAGPEPEPEPAGPTGVKGTDRVTIRAVGRRVRVVGDRSVATASVDGPHVLRRQGSVLEITSDGELGPKLPGFSALRPPRSLDDLAGLGLGKGVTVRVNPAIQVDAEVTAGSLTVEHVPFLGRVRVTAGGAGIKGVRQVADALVQAGSMTVEGPIKVGRSRLRVESGSPNLVLAAGADVTVRGDAQLGRISWPGDRGNLDEVAFGNGTARLDLQVVMGGASVKEAEA